MKEFRKHADALVPHRAKWTGTLQRGDRAPRLRCTIKGYANWQEVVADLDAQTAAEFANAMKLPAEDFAQAVEDTLETLDFEGRFEEMTGLIDYVIANPHMGLIAVGKSEQNRAFRRLRTWRLQEATDVDRGRTEKWRKAAVKFREQP